VIEDGSFPDETTYTLVTQPPPAELRSPPGGSISTPGSLTSLDSQREALRLDEARRTQLFAALATLVSIAVIATLPILGGDADAKLLHLIGLALCGVSGAALWLVLRDPERYRPWMAAGFAGVAGIGLTSAVFFWGVLSSALIFAPIAVYYFSAGESQRPALIVFLTSCIPQGIVGVLIAAGQLDDPGLIRPLHLDRVAQLSAIALAQLGLAVTYVMARRFRRSVTMAMSQVEETVRVLAKREALLDEVRQELERARRVGGAGLFTGQVFGSYRLGVILGRGAMGEVYAACHVDNEAPAAVKILSPIATSNPELVQRFLREVEIAGALRARNVVAVLELPAKDARFPFIAMERLHGESLADVLRDTPRFAPARAVEMVRDLAAGVDAAHAAGIVHRDLKPHNVFRHDGDDGPVWKILDFGVSKLIGQEVSLTADRLVGTPAYMAPEQVRRGDVDHRADIHALGVLTYRVLTGRPAFTGGDLPQILYAVAHTMPPRPGAMATLPPAVDAVLAVALAKEPSARFAKASELAAALADAVNGTISPELAARAERILAEQPWD
jgi:serine/threonine-protein kinase